MSLVLPFLFLPNTVCIHVVFVNASSQHAFLLPFLLYHHHCSTPAHCNFLNLSEVHVVLELRCTNCSLWGEIVGPGKAMSCDSRPKCDHPKQKRLLQFKSPPF